MSFPPRVSVSDYRHIFNVHDAPHEVEGRCNPAIDIATTTVIRRDDETPELNSVSIVAVRLASFDEFQEVVTHTLALTLFYLDSNTLLGVVEVDAVVEALVFPELSSRVPTGFGCVFILVFRQQIGDFAVEGLQFVTTLGIEEYTGFYALDCSHYLVKFELGKFPIFCLISVITERIGGNNLNHDIPRFPPLQYHLTDYSVKVRTRRTLSQRRDRFN